MRPLISQCCPYENVTREWNQGKGALGAMKAFRCKMAKTLQNHNHGVRSAERRGGWPHLAIKSQQHTSYVWRTVTSGRYYCSSLLLVMTPLALQKPMSHPSPPAQCPRNYVVSHTEAEAELSEVLCSIPTAFTLGCPEALVFHFLMNVLISTDL